MEELLTGKMFPSKRREKTFGKAREQEQKGKHRLSLYFVTKSRGKSNVLMQLRFSIWKYALSMNFFRELRSITGCMGPHFLGTRNRQL